MERLSSRTKIFIGLAMLFFIIVMGVVGYMFIEGDEFLDALYMTAITISTVGFGEIHELSSGGKIFTIILIILSFTTYAYALTTISTHFFEGQLQYFIKGYRIKSLKKMQNHVVVCGYGRNGQQVIKELIAHDHRFIVIDENHDLIVKNLEKSGRFIEGDATQDETLLKANIRTAKALITTLPVDADNLYVVLTARALNPDLIIISRASNESSEAKLRMAGVDSVVMPERVGGAHMANLITRPDIIEFMEHVSVHGDDPTNLEEIVCSDLPEQARSKSIYEIGIRKKTGANIIGYKTTDGRYILNPSADTKVIPGSKLFVLGTPEQIEKMKEIFREME
ncbi:MAG: potassium channel protein [Bacteroidetes bacterium]|nr:potassium channel protein [Bacteroidota bacterium]MBL7104072.1 potassium channel protein [Bacteroidales bacterium]